MTNILRKQLVRASAAVLSGITGLNGQLIVNKTTRRLHLMDGVTPGGKDLRTLEAGAVQTADLADGSVNLAKLSPTVWVRDRLINGGMQVDQRYAGASHTIPTGRLAYTIDRWWALASGASVTGQRVLNPAGAGYRYRISGSAGNTGVQYGQRIEAEGSRDLAGSVATLQAKLSTSAGSVVSWTASYANASDVFDTKIQIATGTWTTSPTEALYSTQIQIPAAATTGIEIVFYIPALGASATWTIGDCQFESGPVATALEKLKYSDVLRKCQRYFEKSYNQKDAIGSAIGFYGAHSWGGQQWRSGPKFSAVKRAAPSITLYGPNTGRIGYAYSTNPDTETTISVGEISDASFRSMNNLSSPDNSFHWAADSEL